MSKDGHRPEEKYGLEESMYFLDITNKTRKTKKHLLRVVG